MGGSEVVEVSLSLSLKLSRGDVADALRTLSQPFTHAAALWRTAMIQIATIFEDRFTQVLA
jgi:hypothetical protein